MEGSGTEGVANVDYAAQHTTVYTNSRVRAAQVGWGEDTDLLLVADFVHAIREDRAPMASGEDGLRAVEIVEAAYASIASGEAVLVQRG